SQVALAKRAISPGASAGPPASAAERFLAGGRPRPRRRVGGRPAGTGVGRFPQIYELSGAVIHGPWARPINYEKFGGAGLPARRVGCALRILFPLPADLVRTGGTPVPPIPRTFRSRICGYGKMKAGRRKDAGSLAHVELCHHVGADGAHR